MKNIKRKTIYKTINLINNKFYIGKSEKYDPNYLGSGTILNYAIKKYGRENFKKEIIEECFTRKKLNEREIYWIDKLNPPYNIAKGGMGGDTLSNHPELEKIKKKLKGKNNPMFGRKHTKEAIQSIKDKKTGVKMKKEVKRKISKWLKNQPLSFYEKSISFMAKANKKKIKQIINEKEILYNSIKEASENTRIPRTSISAVLCKRLLTTKDKSKWEYVS